MMLFASLAMLLAARLEPRATQTTLQSSVELEIYDVADLLARPCLHFEPPKLGDQPHPAPRSRPAEPAKISGEAKLSDSLSDAERTTHNAKLLEALVSKYITPKLEHPTQTVAATYHGSLLANLRPEQHEWLRKFLDEQRRFDGLIQIEARAFRVQRGALQQLGIESSALLSSEAERELFLEALGGVRPTPESINSPRLMVFANQRANIAVTTHFSYIKDYTVEVVEPGRQHIIDPQIGVIREGLLLDVRPTPLPGDNVALELTFETAEVLRPIATRKVRVEAGSEREVEIALPEVASARIASTVLLGDGASFVLSTPSRSDERDVVIVIKASRTTPTAATGQAK